MQNQILSFLFLFFLLISCNTNCLTKDGFITSYDTFIDSTTKENLSEEDFEKTQSDFETFTTECYNRFQTSMTNKEKIHFWQQTVSYQADRYEYGNLENLLSPELQKAFEDDLETFTSEGKEELMKIFRDEVAPNLNNAIDEVVKGVEEIGNSLKEWLKEVEKE